MNNITWKDLKNFLNTNNLSNLDAHVLIHNPETGDEYTVNLITIMDSKNNTRTVLSINYELVYNEYK
jgi:hypothetical protein